MTPYNVMDSSRPAYQALAADLQQKILAGEYPPDRRLPTEQELAADVGVSRQTVRHAFAQLVADSLVYRVRGRGTFTTPFASSGSYVRSLGSVEDLLALALDTEIEVIKPLIRCANVDIAARLELPSDEIMEVMFIRLHHGEAFCATTVYLPAEIGRRLAAVELLSVPGRRMAHTVIGLLETTLGIPIGGAHQSITAQTAPPDVAALIDCGPGDPVLRIDRVYFDRAGSRVELAVTYANPVRYAYRLELRRSIGRE